MEILLVRHAHAGKPDAKAYPDDDNRPLSDKGRKAFKRGAKGIKEIIRIKGFKDEGEGARPIAKPVMRILASPAERTMHTARLLAHALGLDRERVSAVPDLHHSILPAIALARLSRLRLPRRVALVGHEPWLGELASLLIAGDTRSRIEFAKGGACLVEASRLAKGQGRLLWLMTPEQLAVLA